MRELRLYENIKPNSGFEDHYIFSSLASYFTQIDANLKWTYTLDSYRMVNGTVMLNATFASVMPPTKLTLRKAEKITYIAEYDSDENYARFYFVSSVYDKSGYICFDLILDQWGTYIRNAVFSKFHINRCNRQIGNGKYDPVQNTYGSTQPLAILGDDNESPADYAAVFLLSYNVSQSVFGNSQITKTSIFAVKLSDIYDVVHNIYPSADTVGIIQKSIDWIGGIHAVAAHLGQLSAQPLRMWLVPYSVLAFENLGAVIYSKCPTTDGNETQLNAFIVKPRVVNQTFDMDRYGGLTPSLPWANIMPRYHVEVGTRYHTVALERLTNSHEVKIRYVFSNSSVRVLICQGANEKEITDAFEIEMTTNNATETGIAKFTKIIEKATQAIATVAAGYMAGGAAGAVVAGTTFGVKEISRLAEGKQPLQSLGCGDGASVFMSEFDEQKIHYPLCISVTNSCSDEVEHAFYTGASFDVFNDDFDNIAAQPLIVDWAYTVNDTFIASDSFEITGVNEECEAYIREEFRRGIWVYVLS